MTIWWGWSGSEQARPSPGWRLWLERGPGLLCTGWMLLPQRCVLYPQCCRVPQVRDPRPLRIGWMLQLHGLCLLPWWSPRPLHLDCVLHGWVLQPQR